MDDLIRRQTVLDGIEELKRSPWYQGEGYAVRKDAVEIVEQLCVKDIPSAQPEIIRCGECKHRDPEDKKCDCGHDIVWQLPRGDDWYCADAERRTDETDY